MAKMSMARRRSLPKSKFAIPEKAPGSGSYPITSRRQAAVAKGFAAMHATPSEQQRVNAKANAMLRRKGTTGVTTGVGKLGYDKEQL